LPAPGAGSDDGAVTEVLIFSTVVALVGIVVWIVLLLWAAREDGRDPYVLLDRAGEGAGHEAVPPTGAFVVESATMEKLNHLVKRVSAGVISILITGETGVGKEVLARSVHELSGRPGQLVAPARRLESRSGLLPSILVSSICPIAKP